MVWLELGFLGLCQFNNSKMLHTSACSGEHQITISSAQNLTKNRLMLKGNAVFKVETRQGRRGRGGINSDLRSFLDFKRYFLGKLLSRFQAELHAAAPEVIVGVELDLSGWSPRLPRVHNCPQNT